MNLRALNTTEGKTTTDYLIVQTNNSPFWVRQQHNLLWVRTRRRRSSPEIRKTRTYSVLPIFSIQAFYAPSAATPTKSARPLGTSLLQESQGEKHLISTFCLNICHPKWQKKATLNSVPLMNQISFNIFLLCQHASTSNQRAEEIISNHMFCRAILL